MNIFLNKDLKPTKHDDLNSESWVLAFGQGVMMRKEHFARAGAVVQLHSHPNDQITHVIQGSLEVRNKDGVVAVLKADDSVYIPPNELHGVKILEDNTYTKDAFAPIRVDHLIDSMKDNTYAEAFSAAVHPGSIEKDA